MQLLAEGAVDALIDYFSKNLEAKLALIENDYADRLPLPAPDYFAGERMLTEFGQNYPRIYVFCDGGPINHYTAEATTAEHDVEIVVACEAFDTATLRRLRYRYMRAIWEVFAERYFRGPGDDYHSIGEPEIEFERLDSAAETTQSYKATATLRVTLEKQEYN